tara:strand:- start:731 stop:1282 length:552 start_codon:yes stop_codon:yes gene_type:complete
MAIDYLDLDNSNLEDICKNQISKSKAFIDYNETQSEALDLTDVGLLELINVVEEKVNFLHKEVGLSLSYKQKINFAWANISNSRYTRQPHTHYECAFSCVYYVKGNKDAGNIELMTPVAAKCHVVYPDHILNYNRFTSDRYWHEPIPGKLLIFPSWIPHYVHPNVDESERISIAFNTRFVKVE